MSLEESPDDFVGVYISAGLADYELWEILLAAGPRVAAADYGIESDFGVIAAAGIDFAARFEAIGRFRRQ